MLVYVLLLSIIVFMHIISVTKKNKKLNKIMLLFLLFFIVIIQTFRSTTVGTDLVSYQYYFNNWGQMRIKQLFSIDGSIEFFYKLLNKFIYGIGLDFKYLLMIVSIATYAPLVYISHKYSKYPFISVLVFVTLGFFVFSLSGLRQSIAIGLVVLNFKYVYEKKPFKYLLLIVVAALFHKSAYLVIPLYFVFNYKLPKKLLFLIPVLVVSVYLFRAEITQILTNLYPDGYGFVETGATNFMLFLLVIYIGTLTTSIIFKNDYMYKLTQIILVAVIIQMFSGYSTIIMRVGYYYFAFLILLIPEFITLFKDIPSKLVIQGLVITFLVTYFLLGIVKSPLNSYPYRFSYEFTLKSEVTINYNNNMSFTNPINVYNPF